MQKAYFINKDCLYEEFAIEPHPGKTGKFVITHYRQFQVCRFRMLAFNGKEFKSNTSASNYLLLKLNQRLAAGEIEDFTVV